MHGRREAAATIGLGCVIVALFLLSHPYTGVRHDGTLYAGEALARIVTGEFHDDLYFLYGSQGRFTVLPVLYAALIDAFGLGAGSIVGLLLAHALYLAAAAYLIAGLVPSGRRAICLLSVVLGWSIYGGTRVFAYAEPFLTARSLAEPAVLFALGLLLRGRKAPAAVMLAIGLAMHPLIAVGGVAVAWLHVAQRDRRWLWLLPIGVALLVALAALHVGPFADLFSRYDAFWLEKLRELNAQAFVSQWSLHDGAVLLFDVSVLLLAWHMEREPGARALYAAALIAGVGATALSIIAVDLASNPFFGKLQVWRAEWIMQWLAIASLPATAISLWRSSLHGRVGAALLAMGWLAPFSLAVAALGPFAALVVALRERFVVSRSLVRLVVGATVAIAFVLFVQTEVRAVSLGVSMGIPAWQIAAQAMTSAVLLATVGAAAIRWMPGRGLVAAAIGVLSLAASFALWDQRAAWTKTLEAHALDQPLWSDLIEPRAKVYWYGDLMAPWILLHHGNYYTSQQGSGAVFSRDMVIELERRSELTANLQFQEQLCRVMNNLNARQSSCEPDTEAVRGICERSGIDYMVLQNRLEAAAPLAQMSTGVVENGYEKRFYLYRCSSLGKG